MLKYVIYLISVLFCHQAISQEVSDEYAIGHYVDAYGQVINGYYDFNYSPKKAIEVSLNLGNVLPPGHLYSLSGEKVEGFINHHFSRPNIKFKPIGGDFKIRTITPDDCKAYVIGADSFVVIRDFTIFRVLGKSLIEENTFVEVIEQVADLTFYKYTEEIDNRPNDFYLVKNQGSEVYHCFPKGIANFKKAAAEVFGDYPSLVRDINNAKYTASDMSTIIKLYKYKKIYDSGKDVLFNKYWDETDVPEKVAFRGQILSVEDSIFHMKYFLADGTPLYEGKYSCFYPHLKRGIFTWFYPDGAERKKIFYRDYKPYKVYNYWPDGSFFNEHAYKEGTIRFDKVHTPTGKSVLNEKGQGKLEFTDPISKKNFTYEYKNSKLNNIYYTTASGDKIFQLCSKNAKLDRVNLKNHSLNYPAKSIINFAHGHILVRCLVDPTGKVQNIHIIKGLDESSDMIVSRINKAIEGKIYFSPGKYNGEKVWQEVLYTFDFRLNGFSRYNNYNYYFYD